MSTRVFFLAVIVAMTGCGDSSDGTPTAPPPASVPFTVTDLRVGTGDEAVAGQPLTVSYTGWLYDANAPDNKGQQFDTAQNFQFTLGVGQVIQGWDPRFQRHARGRPPTARDPTGAGVWVGGSGWCDSAQRDSRVRRRARQRPLTSRRQSFL